MSSKYYFLLPFALSIFQVIFTINSLHIIRLEEVVESIRSIYWFEYRKVYDPVYTNLGWYVVLSAVYKVFGFTLYTARYLRIIVHLISLLALAVILKRLVGEKVAWLPLITIGVSPTLLYFNTMQAQYGIDLQYLPIALYLLLGVATNVTTRRVLLSASLWGFAMIAWMSYPAFAFYLPAIAVLYACLLKKFTDRTVLPVRYGALSVAAFLTPLVVGILYIKNRDILLGGNPFTHRGGMLRGAGVFDGDFGGFVMRLNLYVMNLFQKAYGYYFDMPKVEFSDYYPVITVVFTLMVGVILFTRYRRLRLLLALLFLTLFLNALVANLTQEDIPGMRRYTPTLAAFYALYASACYFVLSNKWKRELIRYACVGIIMLLPMHHLLVYPTNLEGLRRSGSIGVSPWFTYAASPEKSLVFLVDIIQKQVLDLACVDQSQKYVQCRYDEIYASVEGTCLWNKLKCNEIRIYDTQAKTFLPVAKDWLKE